MSPFDPKNLTILLSIIANLGFLLVTKHYAKKSRSRTYFFVFLFSLILWSIFEFSCRIVLGGNLQILAKGIYAAAATIPIAFLFFVLAYTESSLQKVAQIIFSLELVTLELLIIFSEHIVVTLLPEADGNHQVVFGNWYPVYLTHIAIIFFFTLFLILKKYLQEQNIDAKKKIQDILIGTGLAVVLSILTNLIAPSININNVDWLGPIFAIFIVTFTLKGMLSERIFGAKITLQRKTITRIIGSVLLFVYLGTVYLFYNLYLFFTNTSIQVDGKVISHLVAFIISFIVVVAFLTLILISKSKNDAPRTIFGLMLFIIAGWLIALITSELVTKPDLALVAARLPYYLSEWIPALIVIFFYQIIYERLPKKPIIVLLACISIAAIILAQTDLYIKAILILSDGSQEVITGPLYILDALIYLSVIIFCFGLSVKNWKKLSDKQISILKVVLPTFLIGIIPPVVTQVIFPSLGFTYYYGAFGTALGIICIVSGISAAIFRERFMNIKIHFQRNAYLRSITFAITLFYLLTIFALTKVVKEFINQSENILNIFLSNFFPLLLILFLIAFVTYLIAKKHETRTQRSFIFLLLAMLGTLLGSIISSNTETQKILLLERLTFIAAGFIPSLLILFFYHYITNREVSWKKLIWIFTPGILLMILGQTSLVIKSVDFAGNDIRGPLYSIETLYYIWTFLTLFFLIVSNRKHFDPQKKKEVRLLFVGYLIAILPSMLTNVILPNFFNTSRFYETSLSLSIFLFVIATSMAVLRFRFLSIRLFLQRRTMTSSIVVLIAFLYASFVILLLTILNTLRTNIAQSQHPNLLIQKYVFITVALVLMFGFNTYILLQKNKTQIQKVFLYLLITISAGLVLFAGGEIFPRGELSLLLWQRLPYLGFAWFNIAMVYFFHNVAFGKNPSKKQTTIWLVISILFFIISQTPIFIAGAIRTSDLRIAIMTGPLYPYESVFFLAPFVEYAIRILKNWGTLKESSKRQLKILIPGYALSVLPALSSDYISIGNGYVVGLLQYALFLCVFIFIATTYIAIFRERFLQIKIQITSTLVKRVFSGLLILVALPLIVWFIFSKNFVGNGTAGHVLVTGLVILALFPALNALLEKPINKILFKNIHTPTEALKILGSKIKSVFDLQKIIKILLDEIVEKFNLHGAAYFSLSSGTYTLFGHKFYENAQALNPLLTSDFVQKTFRSKEIIRCTEIPKTFYNAKFLAHLEEVRVELIIPFKTESDIVGLLFLKEKKHNEAFSSEEIQALSALSLHLSTSIHNAYLFDQTKNFAHQLEKKVEQATKELQKKNEELAKIHEEKSQFFADIAHEFKTPITVMRGNIDIASAHLPKEQGTALQKEIERMNQLTSDLLELSRAETGQIQLNIENISLNELLSSAISEIESLAQEKNIVICNNLSGKIHIQADKVRFRQIILNLLTNAIKYNKDGGKIDIHASQDATTTRLTIADTGIGIPRDHMKHIFERFYRVDKAYSKRQGGTGLGLAIVKLMTELHGGTIQVESEENHGTKFTICLPKTPNNTAKP